MVYDAKDKEENNLNINLLYNMITINLIKISKNSNFILIKCVLDANHTCNNEIPIQKFLNKIFSKIKKISELKL